MIFLDTGWLFEETARLSRHADRGARPSRRSLDQAAGRGALARGSGSRIVVLRSRCLLPYPQGGTAGAGAQPFAAGSTDASVFGAARAPIPVVEDDGAKLKFNPFANVSREEIEAIYKLAKLPPHPLVASGYLSVGCMPCSSRTTPARTRGRPLARQSQDRMRHPYDENFLRAGFQRTLRLRNRKQ